jgi:hypothetical protein
MEAPTDKATLIAALEQGRAEWEALLERVGATAMAEPGVEGDWSVKDVLAHVVPYEQYAAAHTSDMARHGTASAAAVAALDAYHREELAAYRRDHADIPDALDTLSGEQLNDLFVAESRATPSAELLARGRQAYDDLLAAVRELSDERLVEPQAEFNGRSFLTMLPYQSYIHYEKHAEAIRLWLSRRAT